MFLTEASVLQYLLDRRFADLESVVDGDFSVANLSRRNRNFGVVCGARQYFLKQPKTWDASGRHTLEQEAALYWQCKTDPGFQPVRALMPESYGYDPVHSILTLEFLGHRSLSRFDGRFDKQVARLAGAAMGAFHRDMRTASGPAILPRRLPWFLSSHRLDAGEEHESDGQRAVIGAIRRDPAFGRALEFLRAGWQEETAVHGDWKLENCLLSDDGLRIQVIDWEFANWGDPLEDVGTMLQSYWGFWLRSPAQYSLPQIRPALRTFLESYAEADGLNPDEIASRAMPYAGARMLQTAYEAVDQEEKLNAAAVCLLQASLNILTRPQWALGQIFGGGRN
ncbi:MAG TPA: aminoglycoside phosphotransferase family protein [Bryobacteraceae bacterium]|nr:aminoglycoside phosphotransferase family protein [Bryobacteraceae bacterium]